MVKKLKCYSISELNEYIKKVGTDECSFYFSEPCHQLLLWTNDHCYGLNDVIDLEALAEKTAKPKKLTKESGLWQYLVSILGNDLHKSDRIEIRGTLLTANDGSTRCCTFVNLKRREDIQDSKCSWSQPDNHFLRQLKSLLEDSHGTTLGDLFEFEE